MSFNWDNYANNGNFATFKEVNDQVIGTIRNIRDAKDFNGNPCPELILEDDNGEEITVTAGQVMLKSALAEKAPKVGDRIRIVYSGIGDARPGKAPAKLFTVDVKPGARPLPEATEAPF